MDIDKGVEAGCRSGVENPPDCAEDLYFVPTPTRATDGIDVVDTPADCTLRCLFLRMERVLLRSSSLTGVQRGCETEAGKSGDVTAEDEDRKMLPSSSSIGTGCCLYTCGGPGYRRCTGGDLKGDWRKISS